MNSIILNENNNYMTFVDFMLKYQDIIDFILKHKHEDGICYVSKQEIAKHIGLSEWSVSKKLKKFEEFDNAVQKVGTNKYIVNLEDISQSSLYKKILSMYYQLLENPRLSKLPYKKQSELFEMSIKQIQIAYGYLFVEMKK